MNFVMWLISGALNPLVDLSKYALNLFAKKMDDQTQVSLSIIEGQIKLLQQKWIILLQAAFALPLAFYYGKAHVWDAALHLGVTDPMEGDLAMWDRWVMAFLFFHAWVTK